MRYRRSWGASPTWNQLSLWGNQLTGEIPKELGSLANLLGLYLSKNQLTGEIPKELGILANLQELYLGGTPVDRMDPLWIATRDGQTWPAVLC